MGCNSSAVDSAISLDGQQNFKQYILTKNKLNFLDNYINQINTNTTANVNNLKIKKINQINQFQNSAKKFVEDVKIEIEKKEPGSVGKAEALHKKTANQLLGLNQTLQKLQNQKTIANTRCDQEQKDIRTLIAQEYQNIRVTIKLPTQKIPHINSLPEAERQRALKWGDQNSKQQIEAQNKAFKEQLEKKFNFSNFQHRFDSIVPTKNLQDILEEGKEKANRSNINDNKCATC